MKSRMSSFLAVAVVLSMLLTMVSVQPALAKDPDRNSFEAVQATPVATSAVTKGGAANEPTVYIIRLEDAPLASYQGGIPGLEATSPRVTGASKLDANSPASIAYRDYLAGKQAQLIAAMEQSFGREVEVLFQYDAAYNGMAVRLTAQEAADLATFPGVVDVQPDTVLYPTTDYGPAWIGAPGIWDGSDVPGGVGTKGEGVIVGILDTGLNMDHPSFAEVGPSDGYVHINPLGSGNYLGLCLDDPGTWVCNDKLIGYYIYTGEDHEDEDGHGSHTGSTTAGNVLEEGFVDLTPYPYSPAISGVAPHANIIGYDVCDDTGGCPESGSVAATNQAVLDGVDVINFSIGGGTSNPWADAGALAFLSAADAGVVPVTSAGNSGPGAGTVGSPADAPWMLSVGASSHNRAGTNALINMTGGDTPPPADIEGKGFSLSHGPAPIVYAGDYGDALCLNPFPAGTWTNDEIVVCDRGTNPRVAKGWNVMQGGAGGYVLANADAGESLNGDVHHLPAVQITYGDGVTLKAWLASGSGHMATIEGTTLSVDPANGDIMAGFSSRGPLVNAAEDVIKPDVTAPGLDILAADRSNPPDADHPTSEYGVHSGTSQSSPHTAGAAALLRALYPGWSPAQIKSALMSTGTTAGVLKEDGATPADPFDIGGGRVDLSMAAKVGLLLDETTANFENADPAIGGDPATLNLASMGNAQCLETCSWTREVSSTVSTAVEWTASVDVPAGMVLSVTPNVFTLDPGGTQVITVEADVSGMTNDVWAFAEVMLSPDDPGVVPAHFPVAVVPTAGVLPNMVEIETRRNAGSQLVENLQAIEITDLTIDLYGLVQAMLDQFEALEIPDPTVDFPDIFFAGNGHFTEITVPSDSPRLVVEVLDTTSPDLDLLVFYDSNDNGVPELADLDGNECQSAAGGPWERCDVEYPVAGRWFAAIINFTASTPGGSDPVDLAYGAVGGDAGNMTVTGPTSVPELEPFDLRVFWDTPEMVAGDRWYGAFDIGTDPANPGNIGTIPVDIIRHEDDVAKTVSEDVLVTPGSYTLTYIITVQGNITPEDLTYYVTDTIPAGMTYVPGSASASDGVVNVVDDEVTWTGVMEAPGYTYAVETSVTDPACEAPLANSGAYVDLESYGLLTDPDISGDTVWYATDFDGGEFDFFGEYQGEIMNFTDDGFAFFDPSTPGTDPWTNMPIPTADDPNNLMAIFWRDMEIVYDEPTNRGVTLANLTSSGVPVAGVIEYDDVEDWPAGDNPTYDFEVIAYYDPDPGRYEYIFAYDNLVGDVTIGTIGLENADGTFGVQYAYDDIAVTDGMAVCFDLVQLGLEPTTITYQVTVTDPECGTTFTNDADHNTDNPGSLEATASVDVDAICAQPVLAKTVDPVNQYPGEPVTYTITFGNEGDADAMGVVISDVLPAEVEYAWSDPEGTYSDGELVWGPMTLTAGSQITATVVVTIGAEVTPSTWMTNTVYLFYGDEEPLMAQASHHVQAVPVEFYYIYLPLIFQNN